MNTLTKNLLKQFNKIALFAAILSLPVFASAQRVKEGSLNLLKIENGYKDIKLGADIHCIPADELTYMDDNKEYDADSCLSYIYHNDDALKVDSNMQYEQIGLRVFKGKIVNIYLFFSVKDSYKVLRNFIGAYGQFNELPKEYAHIYNWNTLNANLSLTYEGDDIETGVAIFTSNTVTADIKNMRDRKRYLESLASASVDPQTLQAVRELNPTTQQKSVTQ